MDDLKQLEMTLRQLIHKEVDYDKRVDIDKVKEVITLRNLIYKHKGQKPIPKIKSEFTNGIVVGTREYFCASCGHYVGRDSVVSLVIGKNYCDNCGCKVNWALEK